MRSTSSRWARLGVLVLTAALFATACAGSDASTVEAIETNDGGVFVKPPDVLDGETEVIDGQDTAPVPTPPEFDEAAGADTAAPGSDENAPPPAPEAEFVWFDGTDGSISGLLGQPTVLNFWASTCAACIAEMPEFEEVHLDLRDTVAFVGMNTGDRREAADRLAAQTGVTYPLAEDTGSQVFRAFGGFVMPTTIFLDADGAVAFTWSGVLTGDELRRLIDQHIAPGTYQDV